jgi:cysteine desulfurase
VSDYIYLDNAATTPLDPAVLEAMYPYFTDRFFNASSRYEPAQSNRRALETARETVAKILKARPAEIIFTSGGSESDNLAIKGVAYARRARNPQLNHIITSSIEHHAVLYTARYLEERGFRVTYLPVDRQGRVDPEQVHAALSPDTALVSIMLANNEVGTIQPIREIGKITRKAGVPFHTDAVQAAGTLTLDVEELNVDLLSLSAHKFYGPKGVGALYVRRGIPFEPQTQGGEQERGRRAGTENLPGVIGMAAALQLAYQNLAENNRRIETLRDYLVSQVLERVPDTILNGAPSPERLPSNASFCFKGINGETILLEMENRGILCSSGSACAAGSSEPSHVLMAMGYSEELAYTAVRITLGKDIIRVDIEKTINTIIEITNALQYH